MRIWLQKQKKKEEAKAAAQATPAPVETTPPAAEVQPTGDGADKPVESIEEAPKAEGAGSEDVAHEKAEDASQPTGSVAPQTNEVGLCLSACLLHSSTREPRSCGPNLASAVGSLAKMNMIVAARASDHGAPFLLLLVLLLILIRTLLLLRRPSRNVVVAMLPRT